MEKSLDQVKNQTIQGLSRISQFWGFPKAMGAIFGAVYLSPSPLSLNDLVAEVGVTKGAVSTNVRQLERLGMVHKHIIIGTRKDFYIAETDLWKIVKGILQERSKPEFDLAIRTITDGLEMLPDPQTLSPENIQLAEHYHKRLHTLADFFNMLDRIVGLLLAVDAFRIKAFEQFLKKSN